MELAKREDQPNGAMVVRQEFGAQQAQSQAETAIAAVQARETARVNAMFVMAERHPRNWDTVRVRLLQHCDRAGFAEKAWYRKPAGKKLVNGQWVDNFAEGLSARFAEIARMEMGNTEAATSVVYEDDLIRVVRVSVVDLERNNHDGREITVAKVVEKKGKKDKKSGDWSPPEGRDIISQRINSYGEPIWLVKATDDEIRAKQNSEISKTQRDESLRLIPKDIRDDCEVRIFETRNDPQKVDPAQSRKRVIDGFARLNVMPDDLAQYLGVAVDKASPKQVDDLRCLWTAINEGETTFADAMKAKYSEPGEETDVQRDARIQRQLDEQAARIRAAAEQNARKAAEQASPAPAPESAVAGQEKSGGQTSMEQSEDLPRFATLQDAFDAGMPRKVSVNGRIYYLIDGNYRSEEQAQASAPKSRLNLRRPNQ